MNGAQPSGPPLQLPTDLTICGLGGCGKKLVGEICRQEWFLQHYSLGGRHLSVYTMDTDANERYQDEQQRDEVLGIVESFGGRGNVEYDTLYLPNLANISQVSDLAGLDIAEKIKATKSEPGTRVWWLNDPSEKGLHFDELRTIDPFVTDDFGGGVHRRRAISKAIFYKVINEGQAGGFPMFSTMGTTAIVVGLGGGTGSGMFIDLARYIRGQRGETAQIWLFVVLPTTVEGEKEQLNAAVALTELEYLNQTERLFNYIVLTSLGPTGYKKGEEAREEVHEFDAVFPYIFTNFLHLEKGDINIGDAKKPYSSFILADAHIITYPVEELRTFKDQYEVIIGEMEEITASRKRLNLAVGDLLDEIGRTKEAPPTRSDFDYIKKEFGTIEKVWRNEIGRLLDYQTNIAVEFFIENNIPAELRLDMVRTFDDLVGFISRVKNFAQAVKEEELKDDIDRKLFRILPEAFQALETTARIFKRIAAIEDEAMHAALMETLKGREEVAPYIRDLAARRKEVQEEIHLLDAGMQEKQGDLDRMNARLESMEKSADQTLSGTDILLDQYVTLKEKVQAVEGPEKGLQEAINRGIKSLSAGEVKAADRDTWLRAAEVPEVQRDIAAVAHDIDENLSGLAELVEAIALYYYHDMRVRRIDAGGIGSKIIGFINKKPARERRKYDALRRENEEFIKANARYWNLRIDAPFDLYLPADFISSSLGKRADEFRKKITDAVFAHVPVDDPAGIAAIFEAGDRGTIRSALRERLVSGLLVQEQFSEKYSGQEGEVLEIKRRLDAKKAFQTALVRTEEVADGTFPYRRDINKHYKVFFSTVVRVNEQKSHGNMTKKGLYMTRFGEINPRILSLIREDSSLRDLDWDDNGRRELDKLIAEITATYKHLIDNYKLGIHNLMIPISATERWNFGKAGLVVATPSDYIARTITSARVGDQMTREINETLALRNINDSRLVTHGHARPWEIALTFVVAAGFLDNISPLIAGGGYWEIYEKNRDNILHHVLRMHEGEYITRKRILDLKDAGRMSNLEKKGENVSGTVLELYTIRGIREALPR
ncbi:MAG: tubulin-like doman-containing protein [Methanofollis sp.]|uniref:tubulin-like doman-containing protein n=1 Tax=Methanofollis sp. TaxID=2052835 RepID=UPI0026247E60|nr:tubulin-like doman-containing protein [Methanofollis sp.]MDD4253901.1 tubulin-like doman-containing protein [Methanofollis sp.]